MELLTKGIQGYEKKNNATVEMMNEMKKIFDQKLQALEIENNILKEMTNLKDKTEYMSGERSSTNKRKKIEEGKKARATKNSIESPKIQQHQAQEVSVVGESFFIQRKVI